jgi:uncharacterized protein (TIGR02284 family)
MANSNKKAIEVLNDLLQINNDRIEGYTRASQETLESDLKDIFSRFAEDSRKCKQELTTEIQRLGGTPVEGTRTSGKFYRAWMDVKAALTKKDRKAILSSCEFGEDVAKKNYEDALKSKHLLPEFQELVNKQYILIKGDHDKVKTLRDSLVHATV